MFDHCLGNEPTKEYLRKAIGGEKLPHAILFAGPAGVGKSLFAKELAKILLKTKTVETHPDFHEYRPEGKSGLHAIDTLRELISEVHNAPFESSGKVFVIYEAERMQTASANALLKTLEEPNPDTTLILLTEHPSSIMLTIRSRCIFLPLQSTGTLETSVLEKVLFPLLEEKLLYPKILLQLEKIEAVVEDEDPVKKNQKIEQLLTVYLMWYRDQHARRSGVPKKNLFFPEGKEVSRPLPTLESAMKTVGEILLALQRNIKLSSCLERIF